ncbi:GT4 family glycosyltransferase PelF [Saccharothrix algeriensis]|uniref:GT4 family glycosyltransferase PelF n=1 Tax=Saccharothrix algeriensis TaxID=173560 RepID=A0A8T8I0C7_9PSEU|nr:GT4 family glycosyltransferase PelF [Saccharothrix algeriensis]MBM7809945.1 glycosyltransferase involved in cell wall biosynthesis [Saccharothrix algeriensis]QTR04186.1 GT4 family glycosyltransferase PelF [Saccharothrix algeriensis]
MTTREALPVTRTTSLPDTRTRIALVSEGTYPFHPGGVSLWCDQLVRGMPEHAFTVVTLTVDGSERQTWASPDNLVEVVSLPLWGRRPRRARGRPKGFAEAHEAFLRSFIPHTADTPDAFLAALRRLFDLAQTSDLGAALVSNEAVGRLVEVAAQAHGAPLPLHHAVLVADMFEHMLRPLSHPPVRADVCHLAMNGLSALVGLAAKWAHGTPVLMSEHGVYLRERYLGLVDEKMPRAVKGLLLGFHRALAGAAYRSCDMLAPHSGYNRRWQLRNGADEARTRTMYNGIDPEDFPLAQGEPDEPTIVFVGRIDPLKDLHTLIRAFRVVRTELPTARLRMFGPVTRANETYHASCVDLVRELGLADSAVFEGRVPRQVDAYHAGHVVALTSKSEGFPFSLVEAMSTGRPTVCTNVGGVPEAVGDAGFVVPPRDHEAVARACVKLLTDSGLRHRLGQLARRRVLEHFTLQRWNDSYQARYAELALLGRSG